VTVSATDNLYVTPSAQPATRNNAGLLDKATQEAIMKHRWIHTAAAAVLLACSSVYAQTPANTGPVRLEHKFRAGDIQRYKLVAKVNMEFSIPGLPGPQGQQGLAMMTASMVTTLRTKVLGILPDDTAKVNYVYESVDMDFSMPGMPAPDAATKKKLRKEMLKQLPAVTAIVSKYGEFRGFAGPQKWPGGGGPDINNMIAGPNGTGPWSVVFPAEPVSVGDVWLQEIPVLGAGQVKVESTLESLNSLVGNRVAAKIKQSYSGSIDLADLMGAMAGASGMKADQFPAMSGDMGASGWGVAYFDQNKGRVLRADAEINLAMNMTAPVSGAAQTGASPGQSISMAALMGIKVNLINLTR